MFKRLTESGREFLKYPPGDRFVIYHDKFSVHVQSVYLKILLFILSLLFLLVGLALLILPGPGWPFILIACLMLGVLSRRIAAYFDRCEVSIRAYIKKWKK